MGRYGLFPRETVSFRVNSVSWALAIEKRLENLFEEAKKTARERALLCATIGVTKKAFSIDESE